jgi:hypothetical protein
LAAETAPKSARSKLSPLHSTFQYYITHVTEAGQPRLSVCLKACSAESGVRSGYSGIVYNNRQMQQNATVNNHRLLI